MTDNRSAREQAKNRTSGQPTGIENQEKKGKVKEQERADKAAERSKNG